MRQWMRLVRFEFRKSYLSPLMFGIVAAFLLINVISGWSAGQRDAYDSSERKKEQFWNLYEEYGGTITSEKISDLMAIYGPLEAAYEDGSISGEKKPDSLISSDKTDYFFLKDYFVTEMRYDYLYRNYAYGVVEQAKENLSFFTMLGNDYEYKRNEKIMEIYSGRNVSDFTFTYFYRTYLDYDTSLLLVLLLCAFGMASVFVVEKETDMYMLLDTSANGGWKTASVKLVSAMGFAAIISTLFWLTDFLVFMIQSGSLDMLKMPLYALDEYVDSPLNLTMGEYAWMRMGYRTLGVMCVCMIFLLFSMFWKKALVPFFGNIGLALLLERLYTWSDSRYVLRCLNPMELLVREELVKRIEFLPIFGEPISFYRVMISTIAVEAVILALLLVRMNRRGKNSRITRIKFTFPAWKRKVGNRVPTLGMVGYECRKMLMYRKGAVLITLYLGIHLMTLLISNAPYSIVMEENKDSYLSYMEAYGGKVTDEMKSLLEAEKERINAASSQKNKLTQSYYAGELTEAEYRKQKAELEAVTENQNAYAVLYEQYLYAKEKPEERYLLYSNGWLGLLADESPDYVFLVLIVILAVALFCEEYQCDMNILLRTEKKTAGGLSGDKIIAAAGVLTLICGCSILMDYLFHLLRYGLPNGDFPLQSLRVYSAATKHLTLMQAFLLQSGLKLLGCGFSVVLVMFVASCIKKYAPSLMVSLSVLILPFLLINDLQALSQFTGVWGYLSGTVYLAGKVMSYDNQTGERVVVFREADWLTIGWHTLVMLALITVLIYVIWRQNVNRWLVRKR